MNISIYFTTAFRPLSEFKTGGIDYVSGHYFIGIHSYKENKNIYSFT